MKRINIKDSVRNNITGIDAFNTQSIETIAKVIDSSERANTCTINYVNAEGKPEIKTNVLVRLGDIESLGWYPEKDDFVLIKLEGDIPIIIGDASQLITPNKLREKTKFKNNIFSAINESIGGFLI